MKASHMPHKYLVSILERYEIGKDEEKIISVKRIVVSAMYFYFS